MKLFLRRLIHRVKCDPAEQLYERIGRSIDTWVAGKGFLKVLPTVPEIASDIGVGPDQLSRIIRIRTGQTVLGWRKCLRIDEAKTLLREYPALPLSSMASMVGIGDKSNFKRQFTEEVGMSPVEWRKRGAV